MTATITNNEVLAHCVIQDAIKRGVNAFILCPGTRNSPLVSVLKEYPSVEKYYWYEERSGAFFALGRARRDRAPVAIVTTSGTAAGELLPAAMEAFYTHAPLLLITADRPRRFRGKGAPQSAEQVGMFGVYAPFAQDIAEDEKCSLEQWSGLGPAHLNVCFEDPIRPCEGELTASEPRCISQHAQEYVCDFLNRASNLLVIVSTLPDEAREGVTKFLVHLNCPVVLEGVSGLREEKRLAHLRIARTDQLLRSAAEAGYPIDSILRIGGVPTLSLWRDLENLHGKVNVCSINDLPYSGMSWADIVHVSFRDFFSSSQNQKRFNKENALEWLKSDLNYQKKLCMLFREEPYAEASLVYELSRRIPTGAVIYLGNSLPIREWDLAAAHEDRGYKVSASRGVNGIDGQMSTFLGLCRPESDNWALLGDLTTLYDMAGPWILQQLNEINATIVVINNSGGQIFSRFFSDKAFLHPHDLNFRPLAEMWGLKYERWTQIPKAIAYKENRLVEIVPEAAASTRFWKQLGTI